MVVHTDFVCQTIHRKMQHVQRLENVRVVVHP